MPGPGSYRAPSDFGYFEMTKFNGGNFDYSFNMTSPKAKKVDNNIPRFHNQDLAHPSSFPRKLKRPLQ